MKEIIPKLTTCAVVLLWNSANTRHVSAVAVKYQLNKTIITACAQTRNGEMRKSGQVPNIMQKKPARTCCADDHRGFYS